MQVGSVTPEAAKALLDDGWVIVDVRRKAAYEKAHPEGSINIPLF